MSYIIKKYKTKIKFTFSNGDTYNLKTETENNQSLYTYCTSVKLTERLYTPSNTSIIGQISSNLLSIELISRDGLLISTNENSLYYGYMNSSAIIEVWCTDDNNVDTYMGKYWVDTWENANSSSNNYSVSISAVNILNKVKQISLTKVSLQRNISFKKYLITIINKLNKNLPQSMQIKYNESDLNIFNSAGFDWEMYYNNIDRDNIEVIFNNIAQNSLSYIWIDRDGYLKTDCLIDDNENESVASYSGESNIFNYELTNGDIYQYSGIKVNYIDSMSYKDETVLQMSKLALNKGNNNITANLNSDKVINIHHIEIVVPNGSAVCLSFFNYKNTIEMIINSSTDTNDASINIYGTTVTETKDSIIKYKNDNDKSSILEIDNNILRKECIDAYINGFIQLIDMKNGQLVIEGYIEPKIRLGNIISMYGKKLGINEYYKVIGLEYTLGRGYRCRATLLKTINISPDIDTLLYNDNIAVINMMAGVSIKDYQFKVLTTSQEAVVENQLGTILDSLRAYL